MKIAIYLRVSTSHQTTDLQKSELLAYCQARGWNNPEIYDDTGSGANIDRHEFKRMMADARARAFDCLVVFKLDRLSRSLKDLVTTLQELTDLGVAFISIRDHIDMTTAAGRLLVHLLASFAEFEREIISERVRAGVRRAIQNGRPVGRPRVTQDDHVMQLRGEGKTIRAIASELNVSRGAIERVLRKSQAS